MSRHLRCATVPAKASSASSLCSAAPLASCARSTAYTAMLLHSLVRPYPLRRIARVHNPGPHTCRNKAGGSVPAPEGAWRAQLHHLGGKASQKHRRTPEKEMHLLLATPACFATPTFRSRNGRCAVSGRRSDERRHREEEPDRAEGARLHPLDVALRASVRLAPQVGRTLAISCEAVPASEMGRRGHEPALLLRNGAGESFVSFIALFGGPAVLRMPVCRARWSCVSVSSRSDSLSLRPWSCSAGSRVLSEPRMLSARVAQDPDASVGHVLDVGTDRHNAGLAAHCGSASSARTAESASRSLGIDVDLARCAHASRSGRRRAL